MESKKIARAWVLCGGQDCDGFSSYKAIGFETIKEATEYCEESNDWSDGLIFWVTEKYSEVVAYCEECEIDCSIDYSY